MIQTLIDAAPFVVVGVGVLCFVWLVWAEARDHPADRAHHAEADARWDAALPARPICACGGTEYEKINRNGAWCTLVCAGCLGIDRLLPSEDGIGGRVYDLSYALQASEPERTERPPLCECGSKWLSLGDEYDRDSDLVCDNCHRADRLLGRASDPERTEARSGLGSGDVSADPHSAGSSADAPVKHVPRADPSALSLVWFGGRCVWCSRSIDGLHDMQACRADWLKRDAAKRRAS